MVASIAVVEDAASAVLAARSVPGLHAGYPAERHARGPWDAEVAVVSESENDDALPVLHEEDRALACAVGKGDRLAAERLTRRILPTVRRVARALLANRSDAEDATQLALLEVLRASASYRGTGPLESWSRRIASRAVIRYARRSRGSKPETAPHDESMDPRRVSLRTTMLDELPRPLEDYLEELPEVQRLALVLRHALGHTVPEIAELTDAPVPTVKSRLKKAHQELRRLIRRDLNLGIRVEARMS